MKQKIFKDRIKAPLFAIAMISFVFVCISGCADVDFHWEKSRSSESVVGFIDDSLVMVGDYRCWLKTKDSWFTQYEESSGCGRERLCVYNYRVQEKGPRWCDSLSSEDMTGIFGGQMTDSLIWGGEVSKSIQLWKIGERPHKTKLTKKSEGCSIEFRISSLKQWFEGTFIGRSGESLAADGDTCNYAVLDTVAGTLTYKRLDKDLAWIKECNDVRAWGDDVYCVILDDEGENSHILKNRNDLIPTPRKFAIGGFWGDMIKLSGNICSITDDVIMCSDVIWYGNELKFYQNDEVVVDLE